MEQELRPRALRRAARLRPASPDLPLRRARDRCASEEVRASTATALAPVADLLDAGVDYLVCEALAELTLAILQKDRQRDEALGFTRDLPAVPAGRRCPYIVDGRTKFITNAGGINPVAAGRAVVATLRKARRRAALKVATVVGDDVRARGDELGLPDDALFANAYLGARPIVEALDAGAARRGHRPGGRRVAVPRPARPRVRLGLGRLGPPGRRRRRRPPARVQRPGHGRQLLGRVVGEPRPAAHRASRSPRSRPTAAPSSPSPTARAAWSPSTPCASSCSTRCTTRRATSTPTSSPTSRRSPLDDLGDDRVRVSGTRGARRPHLQGPGVHAGRLGRRGPVRLLVARRRGQGARRAALRARAGRGHGRAGRGVARGVLRRRTPTAGRPSAPADGYEPPEVIGRLAWRTADAESAGRVARRIGVLGLSGPPTISGIGPGPRRRAPPSSSSVDAFLVDRKLVDAQVRVQVEEL